MKVMNHRRQKVRGKFNIPLIAGIHCLHVMRPVGAEDLNSPVRIGAVQEFLANTVSSEILFYKHVVKKRSGFNASVGEPPDDMVLVTVRMPDLNSPESIRG